jgi:hypothetical protein
MDHGGVCCRFKGLSHSVATPYCTRDAILHESFDEVIG